MLSGGTTAIATHAGAMGPAAEWGPVRICVANRSVSRAETEDPRVRGAP